jgi:hypothetical protein
VKLAGALRCLACAHQSVGLVGGGTLTDTHPTLSARVFLSLHRLRRYRFDERTNLGHHQPSRRRAGSRAMVIVSAPVDRKPCLPKLAQAPMHRAATA